MRFALFFVALANIGRLAGADVDCAGIIPVDGEACRFLDTFLNEQVEEVLPCSSPNLRCGTFCLNGNECQVNAPDCDGLVLSERHELIALKACQTPEIQVQVELNEVTTQEPPTTPGEATAEPEVLNSVGSGRGSSSGSTNFNADDSFVGWGKKHGKSKKAKSKKKGKKRGFEAVLDDPAQSAAVGALALGAVVTIAAAAAAINRRVKRSGYEVLPESKWQTEDGRVIEF